MDLYFPRMFASRSAALVNRTRRMVPKLLGPFLEIAADSGGSAFCDTQLNCHTLFTTATALLSPSFFGFLLGWPSTCLCGKRALCAECTTRFKLVELTCGTMPILTSWFSASVFQEVFTRLSIELPRLVSTSDVSFSRRTSTSCFGSWWLRGWLGFWCRFCTIITRMPETTWASLRTVPFFSPLVTNTFSSFSAT